MPLELAFIFIIFISTIFYFEVKLLEVPAQTKGTP